MPLEKTEENLKTCQICKRRFQHRKAVAGHIGKTHHITSIDYYNSYYKTLNEEYCLICKNITKFDKHLYRYRTTCSHKCANVISTEKRQETNLKKYGSISPFGSKDIQLKTKNTVLKRYGCENIFQDSNIKDIIKITNLKKYGVENPSCNKEIHQKKIDTCLKHYGVENYLSTDECKERIKLTNLERYGFTCALQSATIKEKAKKTCIDRYGVDNPTKNRDILEKACKIQSKPYTLPSGKIIHKMGYEPQFLNYVFQNNILKENEIIYHPKGIKYIGFDNKEHYYFPDFYIPKWNLIVEVKSTWTLEKDKETYLKEEFTIKNNFKYIRIINIETEKLNFDAFNNLIQMFN